MKRFQLPIISPLLASVLDNYNLGIDKEGVKTNPEYYYNRGVAKTKFGDNQGAIVDIKECLKLKPTHAKGREALVLLGVN